MTDPIVYRHLGPEDFDLLSGVKPGLFDESIRPKQARAFLDDPLHELILAFEGNAAVGMVSGTILLHPDKEPAMFINELGVRESHQRRGIATKLTEAMIALARSRECKGIWLGTEAHNVEAVAFYRTLDCDEVAGFFYGWDDAL